MNTNPIKFVHITVWVKHYLTDWQTVRVTSEHALLVWLNVFQKKDLTSKLSLTKHLSGLKVWKFKSFRRFEQQQLGNLDIFKNANSLKMFSGKQFPIAEIEFHSNIQLEPNRICKNLLFFVSRNKCPCSVPRLWLHSLFNIRSFTLISNSKILPDAT